MIICNNEGRGLRNERKKSDSSSGADLKSVLVAQDEKVKD